MVASRSIVRPERKSLNIFVKTLFKTIWTYLAIASTLVTFLPLPEHWRKVVPFAIAALFVISAYRVVWAVQKQCEDKLRSLQEEIDQLKVKPYDEAQGQLVQEKLQRWTTTERDLLRFLLLRGRVEDQAIGAACQIPPHEGTQAIDRMWRDGLITRSEETIPGRGGIRIYRQINPQFEKILRDLLFPRNETDGRLHFLP